MAGKRRGTCWQDWEEWKYVYDALYSFDDKNRQTLGLQFVDLWRSKTAGKVPLAVECTACLVASDHGLDYQEHFSSYSSRTLSLAMGIIRFVNGMVDQVQKCEYARSVSFIAEEIGIPGWIVDIRHEATHASLPPLEVLEAGLGVSMQWLKDNYWEITFNSINNQMQDDIKANLQKFIIVSSTAKTGKTRQELMEPFKSGFLKYATNAESIKSKFLPVLMEDGLLLPTDEQLSKIKQNDAISHYIKYWIPLLHCLHEKFSFFIPNLIKELILRFENDWLSSASRLYINKLVPHLLTNFMGNKLSFTVANVVLHHCLMHPSKGTQEILEHVGRKLKLSQGLNEQFKDLSCFASSMDNLFSVSDNNFLWPNEDPDKEMRKYFTKNPIDGVDILHLEKIFSNDLDHVELKSWMPIDEIDWGHLPAGSYLQDFAVTSNDGVRQKLIEFANNVDDAYHNAVQDLSTSEPLNMDEQSHFTDSHNKPDSMESFPDNLDTMDSSANKSCISNGLSRESYYGQEIGIIRNSMILF